MDNNVPLKKDAVQLTALSFVTLSKLLHEISQSRNVARTILTRYASSPTTSRPHVAGATKIENATAGGPRRDFAKLLSAFDEVVDNVTVDVGSFVRPTHATLMQFRESKTPIVLEEYKLVLITNPKSGSTILKQLMRRMMGYEEDYHVNTWGKDALPHHWPTNGLNYTAHYPLEKVNEMMTSDEWTRATFVRDPKERALSAFLMLRPGADVDGDVVERAKRGEFTNESAWKRSASGMRWPQLPNCCKRTRGADVNWKLLCLARVHEFDGFLDAIDNGRSSFANFPSGSANSDARVRTGGEFSPDALRKSPGCFDIHWSPLSHWRLDPKFYPAINFVGHLETAQRDIRRLLDKLSPNAWEKFGASGWGRFRNESIFSSSSTVTHAQHSKEHLSRYYTNKDIERRVERIYLADYDNKHLDLKRVPIGHAEAYYENGPFLPSMGA